jgi:hypothetical protein
MNPGTSSATPAAVRSLAQSSTLRLLDRIRRSQRGASICLRHMPIRHCDVLTAILAEAHQHGAKHFQHPVVGLVDVSFDSMELPADPGITLTAYTTAAGSPSEDALKLLASWAATPDPSRERDSGEHTHH